VKPPETPRAFEREHGCTEAEWLRCLPGAVGPHALLALGPGAAQVRIGAGSLHLHWTALPPRRIALVTLPRMAVRYTFDHVDAPARGEFMRYFDLYMQRGGG
jgi:hypothetical protein